MFLPDILSFNIACSCRVLYDISNDLADIYKKYGNNVYIQVGTSNTTSSVLKAYDGIILNKEYASPSFIHCKG